MLLWGICLCSQLNIFHLLPDFQSEAGFKSARLNFPRVVCLIPIWGFFGLLLWLLRSVLPLFNQLHMIHTGDTHVTYVMPWQRVGLQMSQWATQRPLALTDKHWRRDLTPFLLWVTITALPPFLATTAAPILPLPPLWSAHWPLSSSFTPTPSSAGPACHGPHHSHPLSCMSTAFVCGGKHLRNVLRLRRPSTYRCCLCGLVHSELVLCMRNDTLTLQLDMNGKALWL